MAVVALLGRKGGSGKSTLSTNIAAWCARNGHQVMLGDVDRQQSVRSWLQRRSPQAAKVLTWAVDNGKVFRAPPGTTHVVLDTPGGLYDHELAKLVVWIDAVVVPIGPSVFDRDASLDFLKELRKLPKVASGRCKVAVVGMRWPMERVQDWHAQGRHWDTPLLTVIPDSPHYRSCLENGGSLFDMPEVIRERDMPHWQPLLNWLDAIWTSSATAKHPITGVNRVQPLTEPVRPRHDVAPQMPVPSPTPDFSDSPAAADASSPAKPWIPKWLRMV